MWKLAVFSHVYSTWLLSM